MREKSLFDLPKVAFEIFIEKFSIGIEDIIKFDCIWLGTNIKALYFCLPKNSLDEHPALVLLDLFHTKTKEVKLLLLRNPPNLNFDKSVNYEDLEIYSTFETGEVRVNSKEDEGEIVEPYLEIHDSSHGIFVVTSSDSLLSDFYSSVVRKGIIDVYQSSKFSWRKKYFESDTGIISCIRESFVVI